MNVRIQKFMAKNIVLGQRKQLPDIMSRIRCFVNSFIDVRFKTWHITGKGFCKIFLEFLFWLVGWFVVFNATFNNIQLYSGGQFYWWRKPKKNKDLPQVTDKLYHIMLYQVHPAWVGFELTTLVLIGTDYIDSCKSNYHTITTMMAPVLILEITAIN